MSRKGQSKLKPITPDPVFGSTLVSKLVNASMKDGKKSAALKQVYLALELLKKTQTDADPVATLESAIENIKPKIEIRPRRIGGAVYQVPTPVRGTRQISLALRWLVSSARAKSNKAFHSFGEKLADEVAMSLKNEGSAVSKRMEVEKMADANKAFAHLRW